MDVEANAEDADELSLTVVSRQGMRKWDAQCANGSPMREADWSAASVVDRHMLLLAAVYAIFATDGTAIFVPRDMCVRVRFWMHWSL